VSRTEIDQLKTLLEEAKLRLSDLTRELDESMRAEDDKATQAELDRARDRVLVLEHSLERLERDDDGL
jgi:hypothetical protein